MKGSRVTGIILAGGKSSRMGTDKGLMDFNGSKLVEYPLGLLMKHCNEIIISTNNPDYKQFNAQIAEDEFPDKGPAGGLASALAGSSSDWNIVVACDMPFLPWKLFSNLLNCRKGTEGVIPLHKGYIEPLSAIYHRRMADVFFTAVKSDNLSLYKIIETTNIFCFPVNELLEEFPGMFTNFNVPEDLYPHDAD